MTPPTPLLRWLTPAGWIASLGGLILVLVLGLGAAGFRWDPLDLSRRRLDGAERAAAVARAETAARTAEAAGQAGQMARFESAHETLRSLDRATNRSLHSVRTADDADLPLSDDRADRLRDHDRELCRLAPALGGCAATPELAGAGGPAL